MDAATVNCCTLQHTFNQYSYEIELLRQLLKEDMDICAAESGFTFCANEWNMTWTQSRKVTVTRMYVPRAAAD